MTRRAAWATGVLATCVLLAGCTTCKLSESECPTTSTATSGMQALEDSTLAWSYQPTPSTGFVPSPPSGYDCSFKSSPGSLVSKDGTSSELVTPGSVTISCSGAPYGIFDLVISALGDVRDWPVGTMSITAPPTSVVFKNAVATGCGDIDLAGLAMTMTVETAVGGSAPYPQLVTADYRRVLWIDFDTASATPTGGSCFLPFSGKVSLHVYQDRHDFAAYPANGCRCL